MIFAWDALHLWPLLALAVAWPLLALAWKHRGSQGVDAGPQASVVRTEITAGLALVLTAGALLGPRFGEGRERVEERGLDIAIALDVSLSMLAEDAEPSRLVAAQSDLLSGSRDQRGDRWSLVLFAGEAFRRVPLSDDRQAVAEIAALADPGDIALGGTDLATAIAAAVDSLGQNLASLGQSRGPRSQVLLITDGEDPDGRGARAAAAARELGIEVHVLGYGTELGSRLPDGAGGFLLDGDGRPVLSRLNVADLSALAEAGGGNFMRADSTAAPLERWSETALKGKRDRLRASAARAALGHRYGWPTALALLCVCALLAADFRRSS